MCCSGEDLAVVQQTSTALAIGGVLAISYLVLPHRWDWARSGVKTGSVLMLALVAVLHGGGALAAILLACALGDLALSRPGPRAFLTGMAAFGAAHLGFVALFISLGAGPGQITHGTAGLILGVTGVAVWTAKTLGPKAGALKGPLMAYIAAIALMVSAALALPEAPGTAQIALGAILFAGSDYLIGQERFSGWRARGLGEAIWGLYYAAQLFMLFGWMLLS